MKKIYSYSHEFVIPFIPLQKFLINLLILTKFHRRLITSEMLSFCKFQKYRRQVKGGKKNAFTRGKTNHRTTMDTAEKHERKT